MVLFPRDCFSTILIIGQSVYGFMLVKGGQEVILDIADVSGFRHSAINLLEYLERVCENVGVDLNLLSGCVTDNPSVMELLRKYVIFHFCVINKLF